jgi:hypothetical protein
MLRRPAAGLLVMLLSTGLPAAARAATEGTTGASSTGSVALTAALPGLIRITGVDDVNLGRWTGGGDRSVTMRHRVCTNSAGNRFSVTATGDGPAGAFQLADGAATLAYDLRYNDGFPPGGAVALSPGVPLASQRGLAPSGSGPMCGPSGPQNQRLLVRVRRAAFLAAPAGVYRGTLTLLVAPD